MHINGSESPLNVAAPNARWRMTGSGRILHAQESPRSFLSPRCGRARICHLHDRFLIHAGEAPEKSPRSCQTHQALDRYIASREVDDQRSTPKRRRAGGLKGGQLGPPLLILESARNLPCKRIQVDEIWAFVYAKQKNVATAKAAPCQYWRRVDLHRYRY